MKDKNQLYAGIIWIISAMALIIYGILIFFNSNVPGVGELVDFLWAIDKKYIYLAAFVSVFIEGLYLVGNFFPGASSVMIIAIVSGASGYPVLLFTLFLIFIGWSIAGTINIYLAKIYRNKMANLQHLEDYHIKDNMWATWFPAFRSSYEVAQVIEGGHPMKVYISSLRVRFFATLFVGLLALIIPIFINIDNSSDRESFLTIALISGISITVGVRKIRHYWKIK